MQVTLCDTACGTKIAGSKDKITYCRISIGETKYRIGIEVTKPKQKFYRRLDLCDACLNNLKVQLEELFGSFMGHGNPAARLLDLPDSWKENNKNDCAIYNLDPFDLHFEEGETGI